MSDGTSVSCAVSLPTSSNQPNIDDLRQSALGGGEHCSVAAKSVSMNGNVPHGNDTSINSQTANDDDDDGGDGILPTKLDTSSLLAEVLRNGLNNRLSSAEMNSEQTTAKAEDIHPAQVVTKHEVDNEVELTTPHIVLTEDEGTCQTLVSTDDDKTNAFPDMPVIQTTEVTVESAQPVSPVTVPKTNSDQISSTNENGLPISSSDIAGSGNGLHLEIESDAVNSDVHSSDQASGSTPTSPKSPTKKKSFWSKFSIIFKPWKWRRKKRSKKLEQKAVELERRLSVRKTREELIKRGLLKETQNDEDQAKSSPSSDTAGEQTGEQSGAEATDDENNGHGGKVSFSHNLSTDVGTNVTVSSSPEMPRQPGIVNGTMSHDEEYPPPPDYSEPPPYAPPPPPEEFDDDTSSDDEEEHILNTIPLVKEVPIREPDLNAVPKKSALKKTVQTRPVVIIRNPQKSRNAGGDTGSYHSSEDSSDEEVHYRDDDSSDTETQDGLASKVARKDSLARFLENRPDEKDLQERNILHATPEASINSNRQEKAVKLGRKLSMRPTAEDLEYRNILHHNQDNGRRKADIEDIKIKLNRKLSFRPTIEELKQRNILQFSEYVEVTEAEDYDRRADKPWTRLTPRDKAAIRKELNEFKSAEMPVHDESRHLTRFHRP